MKRILPLIGLLLLSTITFGQLSLQDRQENAEHNLIQSGFKVHGMKSSAPFSLNEMQEHIEPNVGLLGIKFGGNLSTITSDSAAENSAYKSGFRGGFMYGVYFSELFTLETGLIYEGKGFAKTNTEKIVEEIGNETITTMTDYDYSAQEGTMQSKTITQDVSGSLDTVLHPIDTLTGDAELYSGIDLGGSIGIGMEWPIEVKGYTGPAPSLFIDLKYQRSLVSIGKATEEEIEVNGDTKTIKYKAPEAFNRGIAVTAGLIFPLSVR